MRILGLTLGFLIAPFAIPAIELRVWHGPWTAEMWAFFLWAAYAAYFGTFIFGIATYLVLRARKWTAFWLAPIAGFTVAGLTWWFVGIVTPFREGGFFDLQSHLDWLQRALWPYGPLGAVVASLVWVMARQEKTIERRAR